MSITSDLNNSPSVPASSNQSPGLFKSIGNAIGGAAKGIGNAFVGGLKDSVNSAKAIPGDVISANGPKAIMDTTGVAGGLGEAAMSPVTGVLNASGVSNAINNNIVQPLADTISNSPTVQKFAGSEAGQATSQLVQAGQNILNVAGGAGMVSGGIGKISDLVTDHSIFQPKADIVSGRIADATPAYSKDLVGENVKNPEGEIVPRVNEGKGMLGNRTVNTSAGEAAQGQELANVENYPDKGTNLQKSQAVGTAIGQEAENMRGGLQTEDQQAPLDTEAQKTKVTNIVKSQLPADIQQSLGVLSPEDEQFMKDMSSKAGTPEPEGGFKDQPAGRVPGLPKTAAGRFYQAVSDAVKGYDGTREGILNLRQSIDSAYENARGKLAWGSDQSNEIDEVNRDIRNSLNKEMGDITQNTDTQSSLKKQSNLYRAKDTLETKAKTEASSKIGRFYQRHPLLHRLATREFLRTAATLTGTAALTAFITKTLEGK